ncbi:hypothetical protein [Frigoriflavimonas asaccharolytica]|uniref:Outer membrane lipoprotein-sorting protein n=1 Tax=Frigoriflavimonas asaccharolytica TaxID=2735899 RepID=A0A8J8GAH6_9FLAO|nr:hypothetical protein [Frigoriflavimonas asaccharolytica]NRS92047.1 hypothetical protein [Frigoriflavimonas asaccharolytica]
MKKLLSFFILFSMSIVAFAATRTGYYASGQTKATILQSVKNFEADMLTYNYKKLSERKANPSDYTQTWSYVSAGSTSEATMRYQFYDDRVLVTMTDAAFISKEGTRLVLLENDPTEVKRKVYESLENVMVTVYFKYLQVSETKVANSSNNVTPTTSTRATYDMITANYLGTDTKDAAKKFSAEYVDVVLKKAYAVNYITSSTADNQEIKYTLEDESGVATILVTYQFRDKDFTIKIKSINYYHKGNKTNIVISKESSTEATSKFYNLIKDYFVDKNANYIAPGSVSEK